jgi:hypothetical protein
MTESINIDISDKPKFYNQQNMNVNKKITWLYDNETFEKKRIRHRNIIELYRQYIKESHNITLLNNLIGLNILKNDFPSMIIQEKNLINIYQEVYKRDITKYEMEYIYLGRKRVNIYIKYLHTLCEYRLQHFYKTKFSNTYDPYIFFMNNNSIKGYINRLYWNEKMKEYKDIGLFNYKSIISNDEIIL